MQKNKKQTCLESGQGYVVGVDGGGTKTIVALADLKGKILKIVKTGPSNPRNVGVKIAAANIASGIRQVLKERKNPPSPRLRRTNKKILSTFIGLAAVEEEFRFKKNKIKSELLKHKEISQIFRGKIKIGSDQIVAFRSGTNEKEGIVLIAGTGCVAHGWGYKKEAKTSGWGYLTDEGSAFWVGQKGLEAIFKDLDGRGSKSLIAKLASKQLQVKDKEDLMRKIYSKEVTEIIPFLSVLVDKAAEMGDKVAQKILTAAGGELALAVKTVIKELNFQKKKFPLVLVGKVLTSKTVLNKVKKEIKEIAPQTQFIQSKQEPVVGAVKLALEHLKE